MFVLSIWLLNRTGSKVLVVEISISSEERLGFSWTSSDRMMHKSWVNVVAVLFDLTLSTYIHLLLKEKIYKICAHYNVHNVG